jgi:hypothetical protein
MPPAGFIDQHRSWHALSEEGGVWIATAGCRGLFVFGPRGLIPTNGLIELENLTSQHFVIEKGDER